MVSSGPKVRKHREKCAYTNQWVRTYPNTETMMNGTTTNVPSPKVLVFWRNVLELLIP